VEAVRAFSSHKPLRLAIFYNCRLAHGFRWSDYLSFGDIHPHHVAALPIGSPHVDGVSFAAGEQRYGLAAIQLRHEFERQGLFRIDRHRHFRTAAAKDTATSEATCKSRL